MNFCAHWLAVPVIHLHFKPAFYIYYVHLVWVGVDCIEMPWELPYLL